MTRSTTTRSVLPTGMFAIVCGVTAIVLSVLLSGAPSVYPTGTTIYHPDKTWNGYTVFITAETEGVMLIDMNGRTVKTWTGFSSAAGGPARIFPGGYVIAGSGGGAPNQEAQALVQQDWNGKEMWRFDRSDQVKNADGQMKWSARQHHDWQRPDFAAGYYAPGSTPAVSSNRTLILTHKDPAAHETGRAGRDSARRARIPHHPAIEGLTG